MRGHSNWSHQPYKQAFHETGDIYICRIAPTGDKIHVEWYENDLGSVEIYYKLRDKDAEFILAEGDRAVAAYEYCNLHGLWKADI